MIKKEYYEGKGGGGVAEVNKGVKESIWVVMAAEFHPFGD